MAAPSPGLHLSTQSPNPSASALDVAHGSAPLAQMQLPGVCLWAVPAFPLKGASGKLRPCGTGQEGPGPLLPGGRKLRQTVWLLRKFSSVMSCCFGRDAQQGEEGAGKLASGLCSWGLIQHLPQDHRTHQAAARGAGLRTSASATASRVRVPGCSPHPAACLARAPCSAASHEASPRPCGSLPSGPGLHLPRCRRRQQVSEPGTSSWTLGAVSHVAAAQALIHRLLFPSKPKLKHQLLPQLMADCTKTSPAAGRGPCVGRGEVEEQGRGRAHSWLCHEGASVRAGAGAREG